MGVGDSVVRSRLRTILLFGLIGALVLVIGYFGVRQWALYKLSAINTPLTPWVRWYVTRSSDPELNEALVRRTEYTTWASVSTEVCIIWSDKGIGAVNHLVNRIDALLAEREGLSSVDRRASRIDIRLFRLFRALFFLIEEAKCGIAIDMLYVGTPEEEEAYIEHYKQVRQKLLKLR